MSEPGTKRALMAELPDEDALLACARELVARGVTRIEAYTPIPVEGLDEVLGAKRSRLAMAAGGGAVFGGAVAYGLEWLTTAWAYPIDSGGRPAHMPLAYTPIAVEMAFLGAALFVFAAMLWRGGLVRLWHPVFEVPGFESATRAGFWIAVDAQDPRYAEAAAVLEVLRGGARELEAAP